MQLANYFLWFMMYSIIGWLYESTICSIPKYHKIINRGYLVGPYCPIYGVGAVVNLILLKNIESLILIFVIAMITSGVVEYITSYIMEKLFQARWWDYSHYPLNLDGRICLYGCIIFGIANVALLKVIQPYVLIMTEKMSFKGIWISSILLFVIIVSDTIFTTIKMNNLNIKLRNIQTIVNSRVNTTISSIVGRGRDIQENLKEFKNEGITLNVSNIKKYFKNSELRILHSFPKFKSIRYGALVDKIKEIIE